MLKMLIADDEPRIRRGLANSLDWESLGITIVDFAENGLDALEKAKAHTPDLCLVDISMPKLSGLAFIEEMMNIHQDMLFIVVTGHDEFNYAQKAITLGIFDYILKPIDEVVLANTINRAIQHIQQHHSERHRQQFMQDLVVKNKPVLLEQLINDILDGVLTNEQIKDLMDIYGIRLNEKITMVLMNFSYGLMRHASTSNKPNQPSASNLIFEICDQLFANDHNVAYGFDMFDNLLLLAQTDRLMKATELIKSLQSQIEATVGARSQLFMADIEQIGQVSNLYSNWLELMENAQSPIIEQAKRYITKHYSDPELSLNQLAKHLKISLGYLSRLFKSEVGITFVEYVSHIRISKSVRLLGNLELKISDISEAAGYKSQHYFSAAFKKEMGVSPIQYRQGRR